MDNIGEDIIHDMDFEEYIGDIINEFRPNNKLLLINPPQFSMNGFNVDIAKKRGYYAYPPIGLVYLAASLEKLNIKVEIVDLNYELLKEAQKNDCVDYEAWKNILMTRIGNFKPSTIGVNCMFSNLENVYYKVFDFLKEIGHFIILAGGTHVSFEYENILKKAFCHFAFTHDSEEKLPYFMNKLLSLKENMPAYKGIFYLYRGKVSETHGLQDLPNIDIDIRRAYHLIPVEKYCEVGSLNQYSRIAGRDEPFSTVSMNRGCRGNCTFCSVRSLMGNKIRCRNTNILIEELKYLKNEKGISHFDWLDDDLLANRENSIELFKMMKEEKLNLKWYANNGIIASGADEYLLRSMVESGCIGFKIGVESGNQEILKKIRKPATLNKLMEASKKFGKFPELFIAGNYIIGFPEERYHQMLDTFVFANALNIDWSGFYICQPLKGTDAFDSFDSLGDERCKKVPENYIPAKETEIAALEKSKKVFSGLDIFRIDMDSEISSVQLKEIWFTFGFITNFINNKNLYLSGQVQKFINWVCAALDAYPYDAGMALFLYLGYAILEDWEKAHKSFEKVRELHEKSVYWKERFTQFKLDIALGKFCSGKEEALKLLNLIRVNTINVIKENTGIDLPIGKNLILHTGVQK